jgi:hypothetical protein
VAESVGLIGLDNHDLVMVQCRPEVVADRAVAENVLVGSAEQTFVY